MAFFSQKSTCDGPNYDGFAYGINLSLDKTFFKYTNRLLIYSILQRFVHGKATNVKNNQPYKKCIYTIVNFSKVETVTLFARFCSNNQLNPRQKLKKRGCVMRTFSRHVLATTCPVFRRRFGLQRSHEKSKNEHIHHHERFALLYL